MRGGSRSIFLQAQHSRAGAVRLDMPVKFLKGIGERRAE
jgi:hypothetical protein